MKNSLRPLGDCSNFVVEEHPQLLARGDVKPLERASAHMGSVASEILVEPLSVQEQRLAHLDLHMLAAGLRRHQAALPSSLEAALQVVGQAGGLTYQDLILSNPLEEDPRTFLMGDLAKMEHLFYEVHRAIERRITQAIHALGEPEAVAHVNANTRELQRLKKGLSASVFPKMRPYYANPEGIPGPSGKYSAGVFTLDALCAGQHPRVRAALSEKMADLAFYPATSLQEDGFAGQEDMQRAFDHPSALPAERLRPVLEALRGFRTAHIGVVGKFLPGVLVGTAGETVGPYLREIRAGLSAALAL